MDLEERVSRKYLMNDEDMQSINNRLCRDSLNPFYRGFLKVLDFEEHIDTSY